MYCPILISLISTEVRCHSVEQAARKVEQVLDSKNGLDRAQDLWCPCKGFVDKHRVFHLGQNICDRSLLAELSVLDQLKGRNLPGPISNASASSARTAALTITSAYMREEFGHTADPEHTFRVDIAAGGVIHQLLASRIEVDFAISCGCTANEGW